MSQNEFREFMSASETAPPAHLNRSILQTIDGKLNPSGQSVFVKMLGIHTVVSLFSLSICSQFGIQTFHVYDAMTTMMKVVGHTYCMAFCGLLYLSLSGIAMSFLLAPEDVKIIRRHKLLQLALLSGVSLGVFLCLGAEILMVPAIVWIAGSLLGGLITIELGWKARAFYRHRVFA